MGPDSTSIRQVHDYTHWQLEQRSVINVGVRGGQFGIDSTIQYSTSKIHQSYIHRYYVVIGVFSKADNLPQERIIFFTNPRRLFRYLFWAIVRLRGITGLFSLKDVKGFALYTCNWETGAHKRLKLDEKGVTDMQLLLWAYKSRSGRVGEGWAQWIHETLNDHSENPRTSPPGKAISIEVIMGWSIFRISIIVLLPVFLSLAVGFWLNSRAWNDLATIQTAWGVASYIATAGALVAALLALVSNFTD